MAPAYAASSITIMPWVDNRLSKAREGRNEAKVTGITSKGITLAAITMNNERLYNGATFLIFDPD
jgi:hypothetical protein